jgi:hypothetical protein
MCDVEHLDVTWPATIERAGVTTTERLSATLTPTTVAPEAFDSLAKTLVRGRSAAVAIVWSVPAFDTDPGGIAVLHSGLLAKGTVMRVAGVLDGGGWGLMPAVPADSALVVIEAGQFVAREATGTITVLETRPVALRLDVTATDSAGTAIRLTGDAQFSARRQRQRCPAVVESG